MNCKPITAIICIRVPNDFSVIQDAVIAKTGGTRWWIAEPDHISYFSLHNLTSLLNKFGFKVELSSCDFPIDWFLLMGDEYLNMPSAASAARSSSCRCLVPCAVRCADLCQRQGLGAIC